MLGMGGGGISHGNQCSVVTKELLRLFITSELIMSDLKYGLKCTSAHITELTIVSADDKQIVSI
jgi:hypothetical protein